MSIQRESDYQFGPQPAAGNGVVASRSSSRVALASLALTCLTGVASGQIPPGDAKPLCTFGSSEIAGWFATGALTANGAVKPADSLNFAEGSEGDCGYYKWASRMFLWLTSQGSGSGMTIETPDFYSISA